jgi:uncharacterized protein YcaQ
VRGLVAGPEVQVDLLRRRSRVPLMAVHQLTREQARRVAVRAQLLDADRPADLIDTVRQLSFLQLDPTAAVAPNAHLVAWTRLGSSYSPAHLDAACSQRSLIELNALIRPTEDFALFRGIMAHNATAPRDQIPSWRAEQRAWVEANDACRRDILARLRASGPLPSRELPDTCVKPWKSTGWTNNRNVTQMLEFLSAFGEVAVAGRTGSERLWDVAERVYPDDPVVPVEESRRIRNERRLRALGIARAKTTQMPVEPADVGDAGELAVVEGVKGEWRVDPLYLQDLDQFEGRAALLSPFDRLAHDRKRAIELFGFEYQLEMYKPAARRRWGYFALPILHTDELIGKLDAIADRKAGILRVNAVHEDVSFTPEVKAAVQAEIEDLASWLELEIDYAS